MNAGVHHPKPQRPCKRAFSDINSDYDPDPLPGSKHPRLLSPLPTLSCPANQSPGGDFQALRSRLPSYRPSRSASASPRPTGVLGRKRCRPQRLPNESRVTAWLENVLPPNPRPAAPSTSRPSSCPPVLDLSRGKHQPPTLAKLRQMSNVQNEESVGSGSGSSPTRSGKLGTSHMFYRDALYDNGIEIDCSGRKMPTELRTFAETKILKRRGSPQLGDEAVARVIDVVEDLVEATEGIASTLTRTDMFPFVRPGIAEGGNSQWSAVPLPNSAECEFAVATPKPDMYFGYSTRQRSSWPTTQRLVINHATARPYTRPVRGVFFPFISVEMKSEAAGGTLHVAVNQAAGSGSHCVNSLLWLLRQAGTLHDLKQEDMVAFTIAMSQRIAVFHIHWYSEVDGRHYMSRLKAYETVEPADIRACNNTVKNILDYGLGQRKAIIGAALKALFPIPAVWKQGCPADSAFSADAPSLIQDVGHVQKKARTDNDLAEEGVVETE
ncbi:hypothetical protein F5Y10DRAFT_187173 [Nemania abortiva]|nr:hypothetical protein F5Y10DRAFT_187173 [Nemania abortiva]